MEVMKLRKTVYLSKEKSALPLLALISLLVIQWTIPGIARPGEGSRGDGGLVPAALLNRPERASDYAILVDKSDQKVFVYHWDNLFKPLKIYRASTGENGGPKSRRNDRRTPEGIYFFTHSYVKRELAPIYGSRAFPIDYPSPLDRKSGRGGYGIWFHGTNKPLEPRDTNGCIVLANRDIDELAAYIRLNDTPAIISSKIEMVDPENLEKEKKEVTEIIDGWRRAWENKEIDQYISFYGQRFKAQGKNRQQWKKFKARLAKKYREIRVEIDNLRLLKNDGVIMAQFNQRYRTDRFESQGEKRLYLQQNSEEWKISGEYFRLAKTARPAPKKPYISGFEDIKAFVSSWRKAWEEEDLQTYISYYDSAFRSRGMNRKAWKKHRQRLNRKHRSLKVDITDLSIVKISNSAAKVSFKQGYQTDQYSDFGLKNLFLIKKGQYWKIKNEEWRPLKGKARP